MDNIKIVFIDIDGTLTDSNQNISIENIDALKTLSNKNIKIVLCSGRWDTYMLKYDEGLNIIDYMITNNGASIVDVKNEKVIYEDVLNDSEIKIISEYCKNNNLKIIYNGKLNRFDSYNQIKTPIYQGVITCTSREEIKKLLEFTKENNLKVPYISYAYFKNIDSNKYTVNISSINTNKGKAIKKLLELLNINKKDSMCFGDNENDIEMFNNCGIKIAMENALEELKNQADYITLSNNENGVAAFINKYIKL